MTDDPVALLREAADKATPGPWFRHYGDVVTGEDDPRDRFEDEPRPARISRAAEHRELRDPQAIADAEFIVTARNNLDAVLAEVVRLRAVEKAVRELADKWEAMAGPDSTAAQVLGRQVVSVEFAVEKLRALGGSDE